MVRFGKTKVAKEKLHGGRKPVNIWDVNVDNIVIWTLVLIINSKYMIEYLDEVIRPVVWILSKRSEYVTTFKVKDEGR